MDGRRSTGRDDNGSAGAAGRRSRRQLQRMFTLKIIIIIERIALDWPCPLHTQYLAYVPLSYIYYRAGRSPISLAPCRVLVASCAHAHVVAPALCVAVVTALRDATDYTVVKGALHSAVGGGCAWLSLALCHTEGAASVTAANYVTSLAAVPASMFILCGGAVLPSVFDVISTCGAAVIPFTFGVICQKRRNTAAHKTLCDTVSPQCHSDGKSCDCLRQSGPIGTTRCDGSRQCNTTSSNFYDNREKSDTKSTNNGESAPLSWDSTARQLCALTLLYVECCDRLVAAEGILYIGDLLVAIALEVTWLATSAATCWAYARAGLIPDEHSRTLALCSVPKDMITLVAAEGACGVSGAARLPALLAAPARAALLAALAP